MKVALYLRVSADDRNIENQHTALLPVIQHRGWSLDPAHVFIDEGISGATPHHKRKALSRALKAAADHEFDVLACWDLSRLGRNLQDVLAIAQKLEQSKVMLYIHTAQIDMTTPAGRLQFQMLGAFAEFEREMIRARILAARANTRAKIPPGQPLYGPTKGTLGGRYPAASPETRQQALAMLAEGHTRLHVAARTGMSKQWVDKLTRQQENRA